MGATMERLDAPDQVIRRGDTIELWYPGCEGNTQHVELGLVDEAVREIHLERWSALRVRVHYEHGRDGYVIEQACRSEWDDDAAQDAYWQEVAFVKAWARRA